MITLIIQVVIWGTNSSDIKKDKLTNDRNYTGKIKTVIVTGIGINQDKAMASAAKSAIKQVVGMYV